MNRIVELLMRRDGISREEAFQLVEQCHEALNDLINEADGSPPYDEAVDIVKDYLGLEPDYLEELLWI